MITYFKAKVHDLITYGVFRKYKMVAEIVHFDKYYNLVPESIAKAIEIVTILYSNIK